MFNCINYIESENYKHLNQTEKEYYFSLIGLNNINNEQKNYIYYIANIIFYYIFNIL